MPHLFGSTASTPGVPGVRRQLLVKASPERWSGLLQTVKSDWDVTWALDDEQFTVELSQGKYSVAAIEAATDAQLFLESSCLEMQNEVAGASSHRTCGESISNLEPPPGASMPGPSTLLNVADESLTPKSPNSRLNESPTQFLLLQGGETPHIEDILERFDHSSILAVLPVNITPADFHRWLDVAHGLHQLLGETRRLQRRLINRRSPIIGQSAPLQRLREQIAFAAQHDWPVLIEAEPGTGRDLVARSIHEASDRAHRPFVKIDCRVHSSTSLSRELFGQSSGTAFESDTGNQIGIYSERAVEAMVAPVGRFEVADGGVLLIEAIDEIALPLQAVLAQTIEKSCFQRIGDHQECRFNVRIIAVTTKDLSTLAEAGQFRDDLLKHFVGPVLKPPPLREIRADIAPLAEHLLERIASRLGVGPIRLFMDSVERLQAHNWPGNVSELESLLERACLLNPGGKLTAEMIDTWLSGASSADDSRLPGLTLAQMERQLIEATFTRCAGNRELTAHSLQIGLRTLSGKLREYGYPPRGGPGSNRQQPDREAA